MSGRGDHVGAGSLVIGNVGEQPGGDHLGNLPADRRAIWPLHPVPVTSGARYIWCLARGATVSSCRGSADVGGDHRDPDVDAVCGQLDAGALDPVHIPVARLGAPTSRKLVKTSGSARSGANRRCRLPSIHSALVSVIAGKSTSTICGHASSGASDNRAPTDPVRRPPPRRGTR